LTYIEDGNVDTFERELNRPDLINFDKRRKIGHILLDILKWQKVPYQFTPDFAIAKYLENVEVMNETLMWKQSLICEAKKKDADTK
jgi:hypothetical protein